MACFYESVARPILFRLDPERAHELSVRALAFFAGIRPLCRALERRIGVTGARPIEAFGLKFPNPVGLAAGFDKNGRAWPAAAALGFGHVEIGTVTARPQPGNPKPRIFRYPAQEALINRLGFNNEGSSAVAGRLSRQPAAGRRRVPLGINLGKSKAVDLDQAIPDYLASFMLLADRADYLVLNVSSPNTPGLRLLQDEARLRELLGAVTAENRARSGWPGRRSVPLLVKIAPDLSFRQIDAVLQAVADFRLDGVIATNTTTARPPEMAGANESGGLSGAPLGSRSTEVVGYISRATGGRLPIIGSGGVVDAATAAQKLEAGAALVQVYTGLIYRGPFFPRALARALADWQGATPGFAGPLPSQITQSA